MDDSDLECLTTYWTLPEVRRVTGGSLYVAQRYEYDVARKTGALVSALIPGGRGPDDIIP